MDQMETSQAEVTATKVSSGFSFKGLIDVISSPTKFYEKLKDNPKVLVPSLGLFVLTAISVFLLGDLIVELQIEAMRAAGNIPESQLNAMSNSSFFKLTPYFGALFVIATPFITGGLAKFIGSFVMSGRASYWQVVSVMAYAEFVYYAGNMVSLPIQVMKESMVPAFSAAVLAPDLAMQEPLFVLLSKISVPYIWEIVVAGIGLSIVFNFSRNKGYLLAVLSLGTLSALHILSAVVGQIFQQ